MEQELSFSSELEHKAYLCELCRVRSTLLTGYKYPVVKHVIELGKIFKKIDFTRDVEGVQPKNLCSNCHAFIGAYQNGGSIPTIQPAMEGT